MKLALFGMTALAAAILQPEISAFDPEPGERTTQATPEYDRYDPAPDPKVQALTEEATNKDAPFYGWHFDEGKNGKVRDYGWYDKKSQGAGSQQAESAKGSAPTRASESLNSKEGKKSSAAQNKAGGTAAGYQSSEVSSQNAANGNKHPQASSSTQSFYGLIKDLHYDHQTLTVENNGKKMKFKLSDKPAAKLNFGETRNFTHFHEGQWVKVHYRSENGVNIASALAETGYIAENKLTGDDRAE